MAQDINIDSIIRRNLAMRKLPLHYYSAMLVMAKRGLEEMHFDSLQKMKFAVINVDTTLHTANLPADYAEAVLVGEEIGDKVKPLGYDPTINQRDDAGTPFPTAEDLYAYESLFLYNEQFGFNGRFFGRPVTFVDSYTINRELGKIRLHNRSDIKKILLVYLSMPEKISNKSVIHPFAQASLHSWINWQWGIYNKEKDQELRRRDFYNDYRILRGRLNKMTTTEIKRIARNNINLTIKN